MVTCWPCETLRAQRSSMPAVVLWLRVHVRGVVVLCGSQGNMFEHRKAPVPVPVAGSRRHRSPVGFGQPRQFGVAAPIMRPMAVVRPEAQAGDEEEAEEAEEVCASCMWRAPLWLCLSSVCLPHTCACGCACPCMALSPPCLCLSLDLCLPVVCVCGVLPFRAAEPVPPVRPGQQPWHSWDHCRRQWCVGQCGRGLPGVPCWQDCACVRVCACVCVCVRVCVRERRGEWAA
jgi:hypothetical protein